MSLVMVSALLARANARAPLTILFANPRMIDTSGGWVCGEGSPYWAAFAWIETHMSCTFLCA